MSLTRNLSSAVLIAGCAVLLSSCGGNETARSAAPASPAPAMATPSSSGASAGPVSPEASPSGAKMSTQASVTAGEGYASRAQGEQGQADGPAMAQPPKGSTSICIQNIWSAITPVISFDSPSASNNNGMTGSGPLAFGATFCVTGDGPKDKFDVGGQITGVPSKSYAFYGNHWIGQPYAFLRQESSGVYQPYCTDDGGFYVGESRTWDDGVVRYVIERRPDNGGKLFWLTIDRSQKPSADGKPALCTK